jgi:hypothetical protein
MHSSTVIVAMKEGSWQFPCLPLTKFKSSKESTSRTSRKFIFGDVTIGFVCFSTHPRRTQDGFKSAWHVDNNPYFIDVKHV